MAEYFKQLINQLNSIWSKLNVTQKIIIVATAVISILGIVSMVTWSSLTPKDDGYSTLFVNLEPADAAQVTEMLKEMGVEYKWENNGKTLVVPKKKLYESRMQLAKNGLPQNGGQGYEIFDELQLGMTDFVQNLNYQRALEGEISQSIETLMEVEKARIHVTIPKPSLFREKKEEATASIVLKLRPGKRLEDRQIRGITHLVASSVEGLKARQVAILDVHGNLLTQGFADNALAEKMDHNLTLERNVESHIEKKLLDLFNGLLGPNMARIKVNSELDFEQVDKTIEKYTPTSKVVRSQQREDGAVKNSPITGDENNENSITNYEIDKSVARVMNAPGARKRTTVSVVVDGKYEVNEEGEKVFKNRSDTELKQFTDLVKNAVGFKENGEDVVYVTSIQFDREYFKKEKAAIKRMERNELVQYWGKIAVVGIIILLGFFFLRSLAKNIAVAMNPPLPQYATPDLEPEEEEIPEHVLRQSELLDRIETITKENPTNVASLIKGWINEMPKMDNDKKGRR